MPRSLLYIRGSLIAVAMGLAIVLFSLPANALPSQGTSAGTVITSVSTNLEITYTDANSNLQPTVNASSDVTASVSAIYGLDKSEFSPDLDNAISAGGTTSYTLYFRNVANTSDTVSFNFNATTINYQGTFGSAWQVSPLSLSSQTLSEFAVATVSFTVTASASAQNGSKGFVTVNAITNSTPVGTYTGFNTNIYGGSPTLNYVTMTTVSGPDIVIVTKNLLLITAPTVNGYAGNATDPVPGSKLKYQIVLKSQGTTANLVTLMQAIPVHTDYLRGSMVITDTSSAGTTPVKEYFNGSAYVTDSGSTVDTSVTRIRFSFAQMKPATRFVTLNFTVVVK